MNDETTAVGNVVQHAEFKSEGDWINEILTECCTIREEGEEAQKAIKDDDGKVITPAVRAKAAITQIDIEALHSLAEENSLTVREYPNVGMTRMNIGNMLRAAARRRGGLYINGDWQDAPEGFKTNVRESRDGEKYPTKKGKVVVEEDDSGDDDHDTPNTSSDW